MYSRVFAVLSDVVAGWAGSLAYLSPEVINNQIYGRPVDIWACGTHYSVATL